MFMTEHDFEIDGDEDERATDEDESGGVEETTWEWDGESWRRVASGSLSWVVTNRRERRFRPR